MMNISQMRLNSLFPTDKKKPRNSGYSILDEFINNIMPMIQGQGDVNRLRQEGDLKAEQQRTDNAVRTQFNLGRVAPALPQIAQSLAQPPEMRTVMGGGINPYQEAQIDFKNRELASRKALAKQKQEEIERKNLVTEEDKKKRTELLVSKAKNDNLTESEEIELRGLTGLTKQELIGKQRSEQITQSGDIGSRQIVERGDQNIRRGELEKELITLRGDQSVRAINRRGQIEKELIPLRGEQTRITNEQRAMLETELINLRGDNTQAAIERRGEIESQLQADKASVVKPESSTQQKTAIQLKYNRLINEKPEYRDFVELDDDGFVKVLEVSKPGKLWGNTTGPTEAQRQEILKYLGMSDEKKEVKKDSLGIR